MASDDPLEPLMTFRPRIAGKRSEADPHRAPLLLSEMRRRLNRHRPPSRRAPAPQRGVAGVTEPGSLSRRCLVKSHYVPVWGAGRDAARLHLSYLERDGVERDGSRGVLYGAEEEFDAASFAAEIPGEPRQFRFIVSPEDAGELDLHSFTRELMARMGEDLGRPLVWAAVNHHNTEHPHVHVVVRGMDGAGKQLRIPSSYIKRDMRWRAQEIATGELGLRSGIDFARQRAAEIGQERLTSLDRRLSDLAADGQHLDARQLAKLGKQERPSLLARLQTLRDLGLAHPDQGGAWALSAGWQDSLRALGERGDIIKRIHSVAGGDTSRYRLEGASELVEAIEGVVRGKGLHDELTGDLFAVVETAGGDVHYVQVDTPTAELLKVGDVVRVVPTTEPWVKATDRAVAQVAGADRGVYDPEKHLAQLEGGAAARRGGPAPRDLVAGNVRRLGRLERYGLAHRLPGGVWKIPPDLVRQLESREQTHPRHRLRVEYCGADIGVQATHVGPTWLDRQSTGGARAPWGFGAEVEDALTRRRTFLRARGLDSSRPSLMRDLEARERTLLARQLARDLGAEAVEAVAGLRGTLSPCPVLPSGRSYVRVLDERTKRLVVVPATADSRRLEGQVVEVSVDARGRVSLAPARRLNRGDST